jgi:hypothetical protein
VFEHGFEGFEVAVDVADEGSAHEGYPRRFVPFRHTWHTWPVVG